MTAEPKLIEYKFEYQWGGEDTWFTKANRWAQKQKYPINYLAVGFISWLWEKWIDGRVEMEMTSVDKQAEEILKEWEEDAAKYYEPIVESKPSEVEGLDSIRIRHKSFGHNPYDGDWNDAELNYKIWKKDESST